MSNENELQLGMSVDTAEALNNVKQFGAEFKRSADDMKNSLTDASRTEFGENIAEGIGEANITVQEFYEWIKRLEEEWLNTPMFTDRWHELGESIKTVKEEIAKAKNEFAESSNAINTSQIQTGAFRTAISQSTFALREIHPALGSAVSALNPMITGLNTASVRGQGFKAMIAAVGSQLMGPLGIVAGVGILTTVITTLIRTKKSAVDITKEYAAEIQGLRSEIEKMSRATLELAMNTVLKQQSDLVGEVVRKGGELTEEQDKQARLLKEQESIIKNQLRTIGDITNLENERAEINEKIKGLRSIDPNQGPVSARNLELLKQYEGRLKEIDKNLKQLKVSRDSSNKSDSDSIKLYREKLIAELNSINAILAGSIHLQDRIHYEEKRRKILKELVEYLERYINLEARGTDLPVKRRGDLFMDEVDVPDKPNIIKETNAELEVQLALTESLREGYESAGAGIAAAMSQGIYAFKNAKSVLQQFINEMIRATAQALILKGVMAFFNFITGGVSGFIGGAVNTVTSAASPAAGGLGKPSFIPTPGTSGGSINMNINSSPVVMDTMVRGKDVWFVQRKHEGYRRKYYGATN